MALWSLSRSCRFQWPSRLERGGTVTAFADAASNDMVTDRREPAELGRSRWGTRQALRGTAGVAGTQSQSNCRAHEPLISRGSSGRISQWPALRRPLESGLITVDQAQEGNKRFDKAVNGRAILQPVNEALRRKRSELKAGLLRAMCRTERERTSGLTVVDAWYQAQRAASASRIPR
jgi:hypothetical protein